jgi:hypothetical protein
MRLALDKVIELYKTNPIFQDLIETTAATGALTAGQAVMSDMTPEELALAAGATFGAGMIGRPIAGRAGQYLGKYVDKRYPEFGMLTEEVMNELKESAGPLRPLIEAKLEPYKHLGGAAQYFNLMGRGYGDNIAQLAVALAAPGVLGNKEEVG